MTGAGPVRPRGATPGVVIGYPADRGNFPDTVVGLEPQLREGTVIYRGARVGERFQTGHNVVIREETVIGDDVSVWSNSVLDYGCRIGDGVRIHCNCYVAQFSTIEAGAFLAPGVTLTNDLYPGDPRSAELLQGPWIGQGAQVGANATILPFVRVAAGALVGAGSVVTRDVPPGVVVRGSPARVTRRVEDLVPVDVRLQHVTLHLPDEPESSSGGDA